MVFNIVFIAAVVNLAKERMTERRAALHHDAARQPPDATAERARQGHGDPAGRTASSPAATAAPKLA